MDNLTLRVQGGNYMRDHKGLEDIARLVHDDVITIKELEGFSNELVEAIV